MADPIRTIQYPFACDSDGRSIGINEWPHSVLGRCGLCANEMVARQGPIKQWHFAHKGAPCDWESWLHETAKRLIIQGIQAGNWGITYPCGKCHQQYDGFVRWDSVTKVIPERTVVDGTVSDIVVYRATTPIIIEIIVTHYPEHLDRYNQSGLPFFCIQIEDKDDLEGLEEKGTAYLAGGLSPCRKCDDRWQATLQSPMFRWLFLDGEIPNEATQSAWVEEVFTLDVTPIKQRAQAWMERFESN